MLILANSDYSKAVSEIFTVNQTWSINYAHKHCHQCDEDQMKGI